MGRQRAAVDRLAAVGIAVRLVRRTRLGGAGATAELSFSIDGDLVTVYPPCRQSSGGVVGCAHYVIAAESLAAWLSVIVLALAVLYAGMRHRPAAEGDAAGPNGRRP